MTRDAERPLDVRAADGTRLSAYAIGAPDAPVIVLCHGIGLDRRSWGALPDLLAAHLRVVTYDLRGHGESGVPPAGDYSLLTQGDDLGAVIDAATAPGEHAVVVGHSLGGGVILGHAQAADDLRLGAAVFLTTSGASKLVPLLPARGAGGPLASALRTAWTGGFVAIARAVHRLRRRPRIARALVRRTAFGAAADQEDVAFVRMLAANSRPRALAATMRATVAVDPVAWAPALRCPALVLAGASDAISPVEDVRGLADALPDARFAVLDGAGHMAQLTRPQDVADRILDFLRDRGALERRAPAAPRTRRPGW